MVEARAAEMTIEEAEEIDAIEPKEASSAAEESSGDDDEEDEWKWSDSVLDGVMEKNGITDREGFIEFAKSYDMDGNRYLKGSELGAAAADFAAKNSEEDSEEDSEEGSEEDQ